MGASGADFEERWRAAVTNLRVEAERVQATADALPLHVLLTHERSLRPDPLGPLRRQVATFGDYATALACVQALLREHDIGAP